MNLYNSSYCYSPPENSFSMLFPGGGGGATDHPNTNTSYSHEMVFDDQYPNNCYSSSSSSPSSSVDCTLSLGTPSTRHNHQKPSKSSSIWGIFQTKQQPPPPPQSTGPTPIHHHHKSGAAGGGGGGGRGGNNSNNMKGDPLLARRCANCDTTSTPLWRNGPRGPKSLCNACGIRYKKEERRASSATTTNSGSVAGVGPTMIDPQYLMGHQYSWAHQQQTAHHHLGNEFMFVQDDDHRDSDNGMPFLSWRLNVPDRSGLIHDYTY